MKDTFRPELTIVMPFFNKKKLVDKMIDSIRANSYTDWELLAIDDGSDEETIKYLDHHALDDNRVRFIHRLKEPKGAQTCRNMGMDMAKGEFIVFFDSDDYITPGCLETRISKIKNNPDLDFVVFPSGTIENNEFSSKPSRHSYGYRIFKDDIAAFASRNLPFIVWNNIYRLSSLKSRKLYWDIKLSSLQDADFNLRAILSGLKYDYASASPDYGYRICQKSNVSSSIARSNSNESNLYATKNFYKQIQSKYGHKYDRELYLGAFRILNGMSYKGIDVSYGEALCKLIGQYDEKRSGRLFRNMHVATFLQHFLSGHKARQMAFVFEILSIQISALNKKRKIRQYTLKKVSKSI